MICIAASWICIVGFTAVLCMWLTRYKLRWLPGVYFVENWKQLYNGQLKLLIANQNYGMMADGVVLGNDSFYVLISRGGMEDINIELDKLLKWKKM